MGKYDDKNRIKEELRERGKWNVLFSAIRMAATALLIISVSVGVPLFWRGFYYMHIELLQLDKITPWSAAEIREAFDCMMDYCMSGAPFGTGVLKWSEEGMLHFKDCRMLFAIDKHVIIVSVMLIAGLFAVKRTGVIKEIRYRGRGPFFWGALIPVALFTLTALLAAVFDFERAFVVFHQVFFSGKSNWLFDPYTDEIIRVLPEIFFRNCAILIAVTALMLSAVFICMDLFIGKKEN